MFDSPFEYCRICGEHVLLDQTIAECAREHRCRDVAGCPLRRYFTGIAFREGQAADGRPAKRPPKRRRPAPR